MKNYIAIFLILLLLSGNASFAQHKMVGPKAARKEQKMIKKQNKIQAKEYRGHHHKANKKMARARRKTRKFNAKQRREK